MPWSTPFPVPIELADGRKLVTLEDAGRFVENLPKAQHDLPHWQHAVEHLIKAAEGSEAWLMFAEMFMSKALHHSQPVPKKEPRRKAVRPVKIIR